MSPREALMRLRTPAKSATAPSAMLAVAEAHARMATILADLKTLPGAVPVQIARTRPRVHPSHALRTFPIIDVAGILLAFLVAWFAAHLGNTLFLDRAFTSPSLLKEGARFAQFGAVAFGVLVWFWHTGHYRARQPFWLEAQKIVNTFGLAFIVDGFYQSLAKLDFSRMWMVGSWVLAACFVMIGRQMARRWLRLSGDWTLRTLLVGSGATADETRAALRSAPELGYEIAMQVENLPLVLQGAGRSWNQLCDRFDADYVVIALDGQDLVDADDAIAQLVREDIPFAVSPPMGRLPVLGATPHYFFNHNVMLMAHANNLAQPLPRFLKRGMDIFGATFGLLILSPVLLVLTALVARDGGDVFFRDMRVGLDGRPFGCLKFRSMVVDSAAALEAYLDAYPAARAEWNKYHKLRDSDPRVTKIGAFMRKWSLDELPQLINVLRGDMSLVGPRPVNIGESQEYSIELLQYLRVRPGLTGLWQVSGRSDVSFKRRVQMDAWYVRNWSLWHDIAILFKTIPAVVKKKGAC